jgi:serine/threonine protein kinase
MTEVNRFDTVWRLRTLHQIATGLFELHRSEIAHQDVKPSNVVHFPGDEFKLTDLGRSICKTVLCPYETDLYAGDRAYAPPELVYGYKPPDWIQRRFGCDAYLMGSMVVYLFCGVGTTALLISELDPSFRPNKWGDGFFAVLPHLGNAFGKVLNRIETEVSNSQIREDITSTVRYLCEPDPGKRGHPSNRSRRETQYSLERFVALFDLLAFRVAYSQGGNRYVSVR